MSKEEVKALVEEAFKAGERYSDSFNCFGDCQDPDCAIHAAADDPRERLIEQLQAKIK